ncbi:MAG: diacylglycerol kinase family protein [Candidatus Krumholzibacteriia bacterium]
MRAVVIANPIAGPGRGRLSGEEAGRMLAEHGVDARVLRTEAPRDATRLAREAAGVADVVVAVGGDGTVHEVACGLLGTGCPMGVFPSGSGNDLAIGLGIRTPADGLASVLEGTGIEIDGCRLNDDFFFNSVGLLGSGEVSDRAAGMWRWLGRRRYPLAGALVVASYPGQRLQWSMPGGPGPAVIDDLFMLVEVCNGPLTGGGFRFAPDADFGDGLLDACLVRKLDVWTGLRLLPAASRGRRLKHPAVSLIRSGELQFTCFESVAYHRDGEPGRLPAGTHVLRVLDEKLIVRRPLRPDNPAAPDAASR